MVNYSCIVTCLQSGLNLQPPDDCLLEANGTNAYNYVVLDKFPHTTVFFFFNYIYYLMELGDLKTKNKNEMKIK